MSKGLTIIEVIVTVFILSIGVVGIYSAFSVMVIVTSDISDGLIAAYLAQEGVEIVRNIRDNNFLLAVSDINASWTDSLLPQCDGGCAVDYKTGTPGHAGPVYGDAGYLGINADGFYALTSSPAKFKRKITITALNDNVLKVTSEVKWDKKPDLLNPQGVPGSSGVVEYLYNWY